jgi:tRNA nucleotidyltransferase (CCA-adding enzyme)
MMCHLDQNTVSDILSRGRIFEVGGAVRDKYLKPDMRVKDRDYLVTGIPYDELTKILKSHGRVDLVGRSFGVIKFTQSQNEKLLTFDITLPRKEHSTGVGHKDFEVSFDPGIPVEEDLKRRDFTINAMAIALDNDELVDPLDGMVDLKQGQLRMTSVNSFEEDPLRMLRAVQFAARFDLQIEPETFAAMTANSSQIKTVSAERIAEELTKMLTLADGPSVGFRLMQDCGLLEEILPELALTVGVDQPGGYHKYDVFEHTIRCIDACDKNLRLRLAALFHDITKPQAKRISETGATFYGHESTGARAGKRILKRLRYSHDLIDDVSTLVERHMFTTGVTDKGLRRLVRKVGVDLIFDLLDLRRADVIAQGMGGKTDDVDQFEKDIRDELDRKPPFSVSDLAIDGHALMAMFNLPPSRAIGQILDFLMEEVLDNPDNNTKEMLESRARNYYQTRIENSATDSEETE